MSNENYWLTSFDTTLPLDKNSKKRYNEINTMQKNVFDDTFANSALDYLYSNDNLGKTQSFLESNGFPSIEERQYNKQSYGAADENRQMLDLFQSKSNSILNPKLSDDTDRAFLSGLMGEEEEKAYHQSQIADANSAIKQWQSAFIGSPLESQLNGVADSALQKINTVPNTKSDFFNAENNIVPVDNFNLFPENDNNNVSSLLLQDTNNTLSMVNTRTLVDNSLKKLLNKAKQAFQFFGELPYEMQKDIQRSMWRTGARHYLGEEGFDTSLWMLEHALQDNPSDIWRGNDSRIAYLINNDPVYLNSLDEAIKSSKDGTIDTDLQNIQFNEKDLYYSIHKANIHVTGHRQSNGKWIVHATLSDKYDFTEFMTFKDDNGGWSTQFSPGTVANDVALASQILGAINPYHVTVDFYTTR
ncbi:MAG: hypothetical protein E7410_05605 [Ruminococcaceae bacterium]|nr:hypothetical protein [Oscillospiraceae bacterium]